MRKSNFFLRFLSIAALSFALTACSSDDSDGAGKGGKDDGDPDEEVITPTEGVTTEAFYKGDYYGKGTGNLWINFRSEMKYDDLEEDYIGPGYILCLDFNTALAENADFARLAEGIYTCGGASDTHEAFTLNAAEGDSYVTFYESNGSSKTLDVADGTVTVSIRQSYYSIEAALKLDDGTDYAYSFVGTISFINRSDEGQMSNLTQDTALTDMTQALLAYNGTVFTETSDLYIVILAGPEYDLDINYGASDALMFSVNVTPGSAQGIPSGTYTVIDAATADDYPAGTALSGVYDPTYGGYFGSWYFSTRNKTEASVRGGKIDVTDLGNGTYTFDVELQDGYGHRITGRYSGSCRVEDWS